MKAASDWLLGRRVLLCLMLVLPGISPAQLAPPAQPADGSLAWQITQRDFHSETWEAIASVLDPVTGKTLLERHSFTALCSGGNYLDDNGVWQKSIEQFQIAPSGGAVGQFGPGKLIVESNINSATAIDFLSTIDNVRLQSGPLAIGFFDPAQNTNIILAIIRDTAPEQTEANEITFPDCFEAVAGVAAGLHASIRIQYLKAGMSADLLILTPPPDPESLGFSANSRLELYPEFTPDSPVPEQSPRILEAFDPDTCTNSGVIRNQADIRFIKLSWPP